MPASRAARTHWAATSFSTCEPCVSQLPNVISEILKPLFPRYLKSMGFTLADMVAQGKGFPGIICGVVLPGLPSRTDAGLRVLGERDHGARVQNGHMPGVRRLLSGARRLCSLRERRVGGVDLLRSLDVL